MDKKRKAFLKGEAQHIDVTIRIGKGGITEEVLDEVRRQLKHRRLIKAKLLPSVEEDRYEAAEKLAAGAPAELIEVRGRTVVLARD